MPSWSARLVPSAPEHSSTGRSPRRQQQGDTTYIHTSQSSSLPSSQRSPVQRASSSNAPSHDGPRPGRSTSYTFPSLLKGIKKAERTGPGEAGATTSKPNDVVQQGLGQGQLERRPSKGAHKNYAQSTDTDLTKGHCMTCDSLVRWPKDLKVFRCTICLMINDLTPIATPCFESEPGNAPPSRAADCAALPASEKGNHRLAKRCRRTLTFMKQTTYPH